MPLFLQKYNCAIFVYVICLKVYIGSHFWNSFNLNTIHPSCFTVIIKRLLVDNLFLTNYCDFVCIILLWVRIRCTKKMYSTPLWLKIGWSNGSLQYLRNLRIYKALQAQIKNHPILDEFLVIQIRESNDTDKFNALVFHRNEFCVAF